jgi:RNA polymerase sigma-70 factor (ECF subfamily)
MTGGPDRAEEMTQRAFVTAWQMLGQYRGEAAFATWLHRLAVNTVLGELRAERRRESRVQPMADPGDGSLPARASDSGTRMDLEQAIAALPAQARMVFVLHDVEGWKHDEIAARMGLSAGTTKAHLHRARQLLQEALR